MRWRTIRTPLALALAGVVAILAVRRMDEVHAVLLELRAPESVSSVVRARVAESYPDSPRAVLREVARGFDNPLFVTHAGDGSGRLFVVEQGGAIRIVKDGRVLAEPFLDLRRDLDSASGERGLLGLAFAPDYRRSGVFYVAHTAAGPAGVIRRFRVDRDADHADPSSGELVLSMEDPAGNHNGGMIAFGPDGYLYAGTGDGGSAGDPWNNAQNPKSLLGKMLRLDVRTKPYAVPPDNPWVGNDRYRPELWALGLRNPWRFSFDRVTGELWIGDVGQFAWEEIHLEPPGRGGRNYGWKTLEGAHCYSPKQGCAAAGLELPIHEYSHDHGCSVTGGYVYRGRAIPALVGAYLFADYCRGTVWTLDRTEDGAARVAPLLRAKAVSSFGEDEAGEVYLCDHAGGVVHRFAPAGGTTERTSQKAG
jgi:glucose/arabinose dehydrogenase